MPRPLRLAALLLGLFVSVGCGGAEEKNDAEDGGGDTVEAPEYPKSITGRWLVRLVYGAAGADIPTALVDAGEDGTKVEVLATGGFITGGKVEEVAVDGTTFRMRATINDGEVEFDFEGVLERGIVSGNAAVAGEPAVFMFRMMPTKLENLEEVETEKPAGFDEFDRSRRSGESRLLEEFVKQRPSSPLAVDASEVLILLSKSDELTAKEARERIDQHVKLAGRWGERLARFAKLNSARRLVQSGYLPKLAREILGDLDDTSKEEWAKAIAGVEADLDLLEARLALAGDDEAAKQKAVETLQDLQEREPGNEVVTHALAHHAEQTGEKERAMELYARLVALPGMELALVQMWRGEGAEFELPSERLKELWTEAHPDDADGYTSLVDEAYEKWSTYFAKAEDAPAAEGNRVVLLELFTGETCPPCVAADLAIAGAEKLYEQDHLIALRYHQHIPGPDPLANGTTETRFDFYAAPETKGTPTVVVGGTVVSPPASGDPADMILGPSIAEAETSFANLMRTVEPLLAEKTDVAIDLTAEAKEETLTVKAKVAGLPDPVPETLRLFVVIAEPDVDYRAANGIRRQEMVVRWMLPSVSGTEPADGGLALETETKLPELKQQIVDSLDDFENAVNTEFRNRPLDFANLVVVAFVQDTAEGEAHPILQAKLVPLVGKPVFDETGPSANDK